MKEKIELENIEAYFCCRYNSEYAKNEINVKLNNEKISIRFKDAEELVYEVSKLLLRLGINKFGLEKSPQSIIDRYESNIVRQISWELDNISKGMDI